MVLYPNKLPESERVCSGICNQLDENHHQHVWLADAEASYIKDKWRFSMTLCNLFNQKEYRYTTYSAIQQYTSWIKMRPREILVSIQYQL